MMNLPLATNIRTLSILGTRSTLHLNKHLERLEDLEDLEGPGALAGLETLAEDQMPQEEYLLLILSPSNPQQA